MANHKEYKTLRIAIAAGGTGGHIMPALALGEILDNVGIPVETDYICGNRPVELGIYEAAGVKPRIYPVGAVPGSGWVRRTARFAGLTYCFTKTLAGIRRYHAVVGMGGYISGPVLAAAAVGRVPVILHDSNTVLGRVNRMMAPRARLIACGMPLASRPDGVDPSKFVNVGTPVRLQINKGNREEAAASMFMRTDGFTIFICGGSLGARGLNNIMARTLGRLSELWPWDRPLQVIWAAGAANLEEVRKAVQDQPIRGQIFIAPTIERMDLAFALTDLAVSRAGGSWLAEVTMCGIPSLLFPLPHAMDDHQRLNAEVLARHKAAMMFDESQTDPEDVARLIAEFGSQPERLGMMAVAAKKLACPDAARDLARMVVDVAAPGRIS